MEEYLSSPKLTPLDKELSSLLELLEECLITSREATLISVELRLWSWMRLIKCWSLALRKMLSR